MHALRFTLNESAPENAKSIFRKCMQSLADRHNLVKAGVNLQKPPGMTLVMPGLKPAHQRTRRLAGAKSPLGEIVSDCEDCQLVSFKTLELLAWLTAAGVCQAVEVGANNGKVGAS